MAGPLRIMWLSIGGVAVALAAAGAVLPLLPTTPFLLVAAYAFARSSPRLHAWLTDHAVFGPLITAWRRNGSVPRGAKRAAGVVMIAALAGSVIAGVPAVIVGVQALVLAAVALFLFTRPDAEDDG